MIYYYELAGRPRRRVQLKKPGHKTQDLANGIIASLAIILASILKPRGFLLWLVPWNLNIALTVKASLPPSLYG